MKKIVLFFGMALVFGGAFAQGGKPVPAAAKLTNAHLKVFNQALNSGDIGTAVIALNYYITEQGTNTPYADTLAMLYMQQGAFAQCYYWADLRLAARPEDNGLLEMKGVCLDKLQQPKAAIDVFEKLFSKTQNPYHGYKLMELQYGIKRLAECLVTANNTEKLQFKPEFVMSYNVGEQVGRTYLQAGVYNIHGLALYDLDKKADAKAYFERALALDSNFVLARQNLEAMKALEKNPGKLNPNNPVPSPTPGNKQN